jgi:hypothetical protein
MNTMAQPRLKAADRCDRCGAAARVRVLLAGDLELLFCGHHANEHRDALLAADATLFDEQESQH